MSRELPAEPQYWILSEQGGRLVGPYGVGDLQRLVAEGQSFPHTPVRLVGTEEWTEISDVIAWQGSRADSINHQGGTSNETESTEALRRGGSATAQSRNRFATSSSSASRVPTRPINRRTESSSPHPPLAVVVLATIAVGMLAIASALLFWPKTEGSRFASTFEPTPLRDKDWESLGLENLTSEVRNLRQELRQQEQQRESQRRKSQAKLQESRGDEWDLGNPSHPPRNNGASENIPSIAEDDVLPIAPWKPEVVEQSAIEMAKTVKREWIDSTGQFALYANLGKIDGDDVELVKLNGQSIRLPRSQLSERDAGFVTAIEMLGAENEAERFLLQKREQLRRAPRQLPQDDIADSDEKFPIGIGRPRSREEVDRSLFDEYRFRLKQRRTYALQARQTYNANKGPAIYALNDPIPHYYRRQLDSLYVEQVENKRPKPTWILPDGTIVTWGLP